LLQRFLLVGGEQLAALSGDALVEPGAEPGDRRQRRVIPDLRQLGGEIVDDALDQKIAQADAGEPTLAVRDRIEDGAVGGGRIAQRGRLVEQRLHVIRHALHQRDFDEDERLLRHARVEIAEAAPISLEPVLEIGPAADLVHRLIDDELLEERSGRVPRDARQLEEADIEPAREQCLQVELEPGQHRIAPRHRHKLGAHVDQEFDAFGERVELRQERDTWRLQRQAQFALNLAPRALTGGVDQSLAELADSRMVDVELLGEEAQEALAPGGVEGQIRAAEIGGARTTRDGAAACLEAGAQLPAQMLGIVARQLRLGRAAQHAPRRGSDVAPRRAQRAEIAERALDHVIEEAAAAFAHGAPGYRAAPTLASVERAPHAEVAGVLIPLSRRKAPGTLSMMSSATSPGPKAAAAS